MAAGCARDPAAGSAGAGEERGTARRSGTSGESGRARGPPAAGAGWSGQGSARADSPGSGKGALEARGAEPPGRPNLTRDQGSCVSRQQRPPGASPALRATYSVGGRFLFTRYPCVRPGVRGRARARALLLSPLLHPRTGRAKLLQFLLASAWCGAKQSHCASGRARCWC